MAELEEGEQGFKKGGIPQAYLPGWLKPGDLLYWQPGKNSRRGYRDDLSERSKPEYWLDIAEKAKADPELSKYLDAFVQHWGSKEKWAEVQAGMARTGYDASLIKAQREKAGDRVRNSILIAAALAGIGSAVYGATAAGGAGTVAAAPGATTGATTGAVTGA